MALILSDRVQETSTSTGTGTITLAGAVTGYQSFAVIGNTNTTYYTIADQSGSNWEVGIGTYYSGNTSLARTTILASSNANAAVVFTAGTKSVFVTYPAEKAIYSDAGNVTTITNFASANVLITGGTISGSNITIPAANVTGLGTMATQNASSVVITGGTINSVAIQGGTINGAALTNVTYGGLGTMSTQNATTVVITGGTINSVAYTGGTLNNMTIGATTANTGAFTTTTTTILTASGNATSTALNTPNIVEPTTVSGTGAASTINFDVNTQSVYYSTASATANWTVNFRGSSTSTLTSVLANNQTITCTLMATQGATAYYNSLVQIDGSTVTPKWQGGTAPTSGDASSVDVYNYVITKISTAPTYTVLASVTKFA
jgi:hypothetical protein